MIGCAHSRPWSVVVLVVAAAACGSPGDVVSTFDESADGWDTLDTGADLQWVAVGGHPDGHITIQDVMMPDVATLFAPAPFLGDLTGFEEIAFDLRQVEINDKGAPREAFGIITIESPAGSASADLVPGPLGDEWQTWVLPLDAETWGVDEEAWADILASVESISMDVDSYEFTLDSIGVDNAQLTAGGCAADCDANGQLNILDFVCFQQQFQAADPDADCNDDGVLNILDFVCFQQLFQAGCP